MNKAVSLRKTMLSFIKNYPGCSSAQVIYGFPLEKRKSVGSMLQTLKQEGRLTIEKDALSPSNNRWYVA